MKSIGFLFDLDGVLIDSERRYTRLWQGIEKDYPTGIPDFPLVIKGNALHNILERYYPDAQVRKAVRDRCISEERHMRYEYMPGAVELLTRIKDLGIPMALVTSSDRVKMTSLQERLPGVLEWFDAVVDGDMVTNGKPDPEPYLLGASLIGVQPHRCAVLEDALTGIEAARKAGAYVIGMTDTLGRDKIEPEADLTCDDLAELPLNHIISLLKRRP